MNKTFNTLFHLKKPKNYVKGPIPIYIRVTVDGNRFEITANRGCKPENWNTAKGRVAGYKAEAKLLNNYLDLLQAKIFDAQRELLCAGYEVTAHAIKNFLVGKVERKKTILEVYKYHKRRKLSISPGASPSLKSEAKNFTAKNSRSDRKTTPSFTSF